MKLKIAQARRVPRSHTPANTLLGRASQALISDRHSESREEVNICAVSLQSDATCLAKSKESCRVLLSLRLQTCTAKSVQKH